MTAPAPAPRAARTPSLLPALAVLAGLGAAGAIAWLATRVGALEAALAQRAETDGRRGAVLDQVLGELTRMRIEQSTGVVGPQALLEKLRVYAPLAADARTTEPDYKNAKKEMEAVLRAFAAMGKDAWQPIQQRLDELKPEKDFEEIKQLLEAGVAIDRDAGVRQLREVLLGHRLPSPRLRWYAAQALVAHDRQLAQATLRQVLLTESSRGGFNADHARAYPGAAAPDPAAMSTNGFFNFVVHYVRSGDPELEATLLQVLGRSGHDLTTIQECVKALGERRAAKAVPVIEKLYTDPPLQQQNPIFLNYCLQALVDIQGAAARPFLERALPHATSDVVAQKIQALLAQIS